MELWNSRFGGEELDKHYRLGYWVYNLWRYRVNMNIGQDVMHARYPFILGIDLRSLKLCNVLLCSTILVEYWLDCTSYPRAL